jgi:hypothetical protein
VHRGGDKLRPVVSAQALGHSIARDGSFGGFDRFSKDKDNAPVLTNDGNGLSAGFILGMK